jgi:hypothetical protein
VAGEPEDLGSPRRPLMKLREDGLASRNTSLGFLQRTLRNLGHIEAAHSRGDKVHVVTQTVLSLLGLVVFPWAAGVDARVEELDYRTLVAQGWPAWRMSMGRADTLGELARHVRNAIAHRRISFSSDSLDTTDVEIMFEDARKASASPYWRATIRAHALRCFCVKFAELVDDTIG